MQLLPETSNKLGSLVKNVGLSHTMETKDVSNVQFGILLSLVVGVLWNEVSRLGEPIHDHPDGIKLVCRERQTYNEIQADIFPFPSRNVQRLHQSGMPHMISLDRLTRVAFCNIARSLALHSSPPELRFEVMIHLRAFGVNGIFESMTLIENILV
jgi:hypothetical protein